MYYHTNGNKTCVHKCTIYLKLSFLLKKLSLQMVWYMNLYSKIITIFAQNPDVFSVRIDRCQILRLLEASVVGFSEIFLFSLSKLSPMI